MSIDFIKDLTDKTKESLEPVAKINELMTKSMQDAFKQQMDSAKKYSDFASARFKALTQVKDADSLQDFVKDQMNAFSELNEQMMSDLQNLTEAGHKFREEFEEIVNAKDSAKAPKAAAKAAK